jgi:carbonic anhydrase
MEHVLSGFVNFKNKVFPTHRELFAELAGGQSPDVLFITCSDSRIDPNMVTGTKPGDLFIIRNAGNIIPPHTRVAGGVTASIEYAVVVLGVSHIVVCGHTHCGAMGGALNLPSLEGLPHVRDWLDHSRAAVEVAQAQANGGEASLRDVTEQNVLVQLQHLRTHPAVASRLAMSRIELHAWLYDIEAGDLMCYDEDQQKFLPLTKRYEALLAENGHSKAAVAG